VHIGLIASSVAVAVLATPIGEGATHCADAASLTEVLRNGALRLCANPSALPYSNLTDRGGLAGFEVELAEALAHEMGLGLAANWVRNAGEMKKADCDASMGAVASAASYDREGLTGPLTTYLPLRFSRPYADSGVVLVVSSRSSVHRLNDLQGQKIGVAVGGIEHEWLAKHHFRVSVFASQEDIIAAIEAGEIEVGAANPVIVDWYRHEHPGAAVRIPEYEPEPALRWSVSVGLRRADDALVAAMDTAVARVVEQGLAAQIYAKYGVTYLPPSDKGLQ
jgi:polar amino acid transport system substrate-binding protein